MAIVAIKLSSTDVVESLEVSLRKLMLMGKLA
jgi:hypothetical protein